MKPLTSPLFLLPPTFSPFPIRLAQGSLGTLLQPLPAAQGPPSSPLLLLQKGPSPPLPPLQRCNRNTDIGDHLVLDDTCVPEMAESRAVETGIEAMSPADPSRRTSLPVVDLPLSLAVAVADAPSGVGVASTSGPCIVAGPVSACRSRDPCAR